MLMASAAWSQKWGTKLYTQLYMPNYISLSFYAFFQDTPAKETEVSWTLGAVTAGPDT